MSLSDPIADMLTRIRNAVRINKGQVNIKASNICEGIAAVLKKEGYIEDFDRIDDGRQGILRIMLKYDQEGHSIINEIARTSKPGCGPKARRRYEALFRVDIGATDCLAPARELRKIGVVPRGRRTYELANGQTVEYEVGFVEVEFLGDTVPGRVIFGPDDCDPILGVTALELSGVTVDPVTQTLKRLPALLLK